MPKYHVHSIVVYEIEADAPLEAKNMLEDGEVRNPTTVDAWVDSVYDEDQVTRVWPISRFDQLNKQWSNLSRKENT